MHIRILRIISKLFKKAMTIRDLENGLKTEIEKIKSSYNFVNDVTFSGVNNYDELNITIWFIKGHEVSINIKYSNLDLAKKCNYSFYLDRKDEIQDRIDNEVSDIALRLSKIYRLYLQKQGYQF